jgi:integrase
MRAAVGQSLPGRASESEGESAAVICLAGWSSAITVERIARAHGFQRSGEVVQKTVWAALGKGRFPSSRDASPVRAIFRQAFEGAGLPYFPPHSLRHTLGHLAQTACRTPRELKAWSQNLGHENVATTLTSYGTIDPHQQGELIGAISLNPAAQDGDLLRKIRALVR